MTTRKSMKDSLASKKAKESNKKELSKEEKIMDKLEGKSEEPSKKMTIEVPAHLHRKIKTMASQNDAKIKDIIIDFLEKL